MSRPKKNLYKLNDSVGFMTSDEILDSDDEELQNEYFKMLDSLNEQEYHSVGRNRKNDIAYFDNRGRTLWQ